MSERAIEKKGWRERKQREIERGRHTDRLETQNDRYRNRDKEKAREMERDEQRVRESV